MLKQEDTQRLFTEMEVENSLSFAQIVVLCIVAAPVLGSGLGCFKAASNKAQAAKDGAAEAEQSLALVKKHRDKAKKTIEMKRQFKNFEKQPGESHQEQQARMKESIEWEAPAAGESYQEQQARTKPPAAWIMDMQTGGEVLSPERYKALKQFFDKIDKDGDGEITRTEMIMALRKDKKVRVAGLARG